MAYAPPDTDTVHFVGGIGDQSNRHADNGGGATLSAWIGGSPSDFMETDGGPTASATGDDVIITDDGSGNVRLNKVGAFRDVVDGSLAYLHDATNYDVGRYIVIAHTDNICDLDLAYGILDFVSVIIGGAFDDIQNALDEDSTDGETAPQHNRRIMINRDEVNNSIILWNQHGGYITADIWKSVIGHDIDFVELEEGSYVTLDRNGGTQECIRISYLGLVNNCLVRHLHFTNNTIIDPLYRSENGQGHVVDMCKFSNGVGGVYAAGSNCYGFTVTRCVFESTLTNTIIRAYDGARGVLIDQCILYCNGKDGIRVGGGATVSNCIIMNAFIGIRSNSDGIINLINNTFFDTLNACVYIYHEHTTLYAVNNIFHVADPLHDFVILNTAGNVHYENYNISNSTRADRWGQKDPGPNTLDQVDPQFIDEATNDLRLKETSPCINSGLAHYGDGSHTGKINRGAWQRKSLLRHKRCGI